jgi:Bax protein
MLRKLRDVFFFSLIFFALYVSVKVVEFNSRYFPEEIKINDINLTSADSIIFQSDSLLIPVNYIGSVDFRCLNPDLRKDLFIMYILPAIVITRERLLDDMHHVEFIEKRILKKESISKFDSTFLAGIKLKYETDSIGELKKRIFPHPVSLALTQAVLESGWGTSNIFRTGNNIFGIMSYSSEDSRSLMHIQYQEGDDEKFVRTYNSVIESVEHYYLLISKVSSYRKFRQKRWEGSTSNKLLRYLNNYHDDDQYAEMGQSIITGNNLKRYDNIVINPKYKKRTTLISLLIKY